MVWYCGNMKIKRSKTSKDKKHTIFFFLNVNHRKNVIELKSKKKGQERNNITWNCSFRENVRNKKKKIKDKPHLVFDNRFVTNITLTITIQMAY
jgi:hypothetical protein